MASKPRTAEDVSAASCFSLGILTSALSTDCDPYQSLTAIRTSESNRNPQLCPRLPRHSSLSRCAASVRQQCGSQRSASADRCCASARGSSSSRRAWVHISPLRRPYGSTTRCPRRAVAGAPEGRGGRGSLFWSRATRPARPSTCARASGTSTHSTVRVGDAAVAACDRCSRC